MKKSELKKEIKKMEEYLDVYFGLNDENIICKPLDDEVLNTIDLKTDTIEEVKKSIEIKYVDYNLYCTYLFHRTDYRFFIDFKTIDKDYLDNKHNEYLNIIYQLDGSFIF